MQSQDHGAIVAFGYRKAEIPSVSAIATRIQKAMQASDESPAKVSKHGDHVAVLDHAGLRVAIGRQDAKIKGYCSHLVMAVGNAPDLTGARPNRKTHAKRAEGLAAWVEQAMPYDTILQAETPEEVDDKLVRSFLELLEHAEGMTPDENALEDAVMGRVPAADAPVMVETEEPKPKAKRERDRFDPSGIIELEDLAELPPETPQWLLDQAEPTQPLRLTVHTMALSLMLYSAPLGAFLFTYSMLRDVANGNDQETA